MIWELWSAVLVWYMWVSLVLKQTHKLPHSSSKSRFTKTSVLVWKLQHILQVSECKCGTTVRIESNWSQQAQKDKIQPRVWSAMPPGDQSWSCFTGKSQTLWHNTGFCTFPVSKMPDTNTQRKLLSVHPKVQHLVIINIHWMPVRLSIWLFSLTLTWTCTIVLPFCQLCPLFLHAPSTFDVPLSVVLQSCWKQHKLKQ